MRQEPTVIPTLTSPYAQKRRISVLPIYKAPFIRSRISEKGNVHRSLEGA
jgi:hypothetical protein